MSYDVYWYQHKPGYRSLMAQVADEWKKSANPAPDAALRNQAAIAAICAIAPGIVSDNDISSELCGFRTEGMEEDEDLMGFVLLRDGTCADFNWGRGAMRDQAWRQRVQLTAAALFASGYFAYDPQVDRAFSDNTSLMECLVNGRYPTKWADVWRSVKRKFAR